MILHLRDLLWGLFGTLLLTASGVYFTFKTRFIQLDIRGNAKSVFASLCKKGGFSAAATALGGTIGAGSVAGMAIGIAAGGAGSVFWMWVSGFFGMALRYAETKAAFSDRVKTGHGYSGGAMVSLEKHGHHIAATLFCISAVLVSLGTGCMTQTASVADALEGTGVPRLMCAVCAALIFGAVITFGKKAILAANSFLVPLCCLAYLMSLLPMLADGIPRIPDTLGLIMRSAFGFDAMAGGFVAYGFSRAVREGVSRGVFSSEIGMGSAPLAYCAVENADAEQQARSGIAEIFTDTYIISTLTAICLISGGHDSVQSLMRLYYGEAGETALSVMLCVFALASMLCWHYYATVCIQHISTGRTPMAIYACVSVAAAFSGAVIPTGTVWAVADIFNLLMIIPNIFMLFLKARKKHVKPRNSKAV